MRLTVLGPNLMRSDHTFIVHAEGCRDIGLDVKRNLADPPWSSDFESRAAVVDCVYDFLGGDESEDGDPTSPWDRGYGDEFRFMPCTGL